MRINNNIAAMNTHRQLQIADKQLTASLEKLSSGYQINRAADDAAGLSISQRLRAQIAGLKMSSKNADQAKNLIQTAEGALNEIHAMLTRMRELAVQSASDSVDASNRAALNAEFQNLGTEIDRISDSLEYNGITLLDGTFSGTFQIGPNGETDNTITFSISSVKTGELAIDDDDLTSRTNAVTAITAIDSAIDSVSDTRSNIGAIQNRLAYTVTSVDISAENLQSSESAIRDLDISEEISEFTRSQIMSQAATAVLAQANAVPQNVLALFR
jgi:flagellin